ncbi:hybrid sensor histidine kinase/response regulator [Enterovirga sp.]|uniref:hybrid sensor histidine kinase/response regulator n=1 Tax=Enterovirga sp. TaxID=2026350 RepID=UPI002616082A|nr:hybrid sensor histidine kinase/response regulator [Enterovirga sp.]
MRAVLAIGTVVFVLVIAATALLVLEMRERELNDARRGLVNLNAVLAEGASRTLQSVDLVLGTVLDELKAEGVETLADLNRLKSDRNTHEALRARVTGLPQLNAISLIGVDGRLVSFSRGYPAPEIDLSDRNHFQALRDGQDARDIFITEPVVNRGNGAWTVYMARRFVTASGTLVGFVYGALELGYFADFYASLDLPPGTTLALRHRDGNVLVQHSHRAAGPGRTNERAVSQPAHGPDGVMRLSTDRPVPDFPAVVATASRTVPEILREWRRHALLVGLAGGLVAMAVLAVMGALVRQFAAYEEVARAVEERTAAVSGREEVEAQLRQSQKLEAMGQLTSGVAHDFNNLLTVVIGNLDLLARRLPADDERLHRHVESARGGAERAATLTQRLLAFSRRQALAPQAVDVNELVRGMADLFRQTLGENRALTLDLAPDLPKTFADPNQLEAALLNLVVNARDAMPGGGTVTVETRNEAAADGALRPAFVSVAVTDTGTGMPTEVVRRAFEPFFTTKEPGVGTGLGLEQVYGFAKQSSGDVKIDSEVGIGTRICLFLPRLGAEPPEPPRAGPAAPERERGGQTAVVLVVDDHELVRRTSAEALRDEGYVVHEAADAAAALRIIEEEPVQVLFTDIGLPGLDGRDLAAAARRMRPGIAVLFMTGYGQEGAALGTLDPDLPVITKPFPSAALATRVAELLEAAGSRAAT